MVSNCDSDLDHQQQRYGDNHFQVNDDADLNELSAQVGSIRENIKQERVQKGFFTTREAPPSTQLLSTAHCIDRETNLKSILAVSSLLRRVHNDSDISRIQVVSEEIRNLQINHATRRRDTENQTSESIGNGIKRSERINTLLNVASQLRTLSKAALSESIPRTSMSDVSMKTATTSASWDSSENLEEHSSCLVRPIVQESELEQAIDCKRDIVEIHSDQTPQGRDKELVHHERYQLSMHDHNIGEGSSTFNAVNNIHSSETLSDEYMSQSTLPPWNVCTNVAAPHEVQQCAIPPQDDECIPLSMIVMEPGQLESHSPFSAQTHGENTLQRAEENANGQEGVAPPDIFIRSCQTEDDDMVTCTIPSSVPAESYHEEQNSSEGIESSFIQQVNSSSIHSQEKDQGNLRSRQVPSEFTGLTRMPSECSIVSSEDERKRLQVTSGNQEPPTEFKRKEDIRKKEKEQSRKIGTKTCASFHPFAPPSLPHLFHVADIQRSQNYSFVENPARHSRHVPNHLDLSSSKDTNILRGESLLGTGVSILDPSQFRSRRHYNRIVNRQLLMQQNYPRRIQRKEWTYTERCNILLKRKSEIEAINCKGKAGTKAGRSDCQKTRIYTRDDTITNTCQLSTCEPVPSFVPDESWSIFLGLSPSASSDSE